MLGMCTLVERTSGQEGADLPYRNGTVCRFWADPQRRRTGFGADSLHVHRCHAILHRPGSGRVGRHLSRCWLVLCVCDSILTSLVWICFRLEASNLCNRATLACCLAWTLELTLNSYALQWLVVLPLEIIAASMTLDYWNVTVPKAVFVTIFLLAIVIINLFGAKAYGEAEFVFAILKVTAIVGFM
jgi:amino acid transporter